MTRTLNEAALAAWPLPHHAFDADKEERGQVLVIAGSREVPGAAILAANAALRAGAGKLAVAVPVSVAPLIASQLLEARVIALEFDGAGRLMPASSRSLAATARHASAVLIGPGMEEREAATCVELVRSAAPQVALVLDAAAMPAIHALCAGDAGRSVAGNVLLTPHAGEAASLLSIDRQAVLDDPTAAAARLSAECGCVVVLKGATSTLMAPGADAWCHVSSCPGLGTSGSGDVLAGLIAGLAARGAPLTQAAAWGVALHARAGARLAARVGTLGFLARELAPEVPALMVELDRQ